VIMIGLSSEARRDDSASLGVWIYRYSRHIWGSFEGREDNRGVRLWRVRALFVSLPLIILIMSFL
ncbi:MAG: hypothetical protein K2K86_01435, partial [Muribaculaceae bacterium]|nr:hypothetical protein [Muribaculaceae bacterium]